MDTNIDMVNAQTEPGIPAPGTPYHLTLRTPTARWWKPVVGILAAIVVYFGASLLAFMAAVAFDTATGRQHDWSGGMSMSPAMYTATLISLTLLIPAVWAVVRFVHGQPWGFTGSIEGRWRWRIVLRALPATILVFTVYMAAFFWILPSQGERSTEWLAYAVISALVMPFQAAAEEIFFRGYMLRAVGAWFSAQKVAMIVGTLASSLLFMAAHVAQDPWLNLYFFTFGLTLAFAARYSGGIEVPMLVHATNNVVSGALGAYISDMDKAFDRSVGMGGPFMLIQIAFIAAITAALVWWVRRRGEHTVVPAEVGRVTPTGDRLSELSGRNDTAPSGPATQFDETALQLDEPYRQEIDDDRERS